MVALEPNGNNAWPQRAAGDLDFGREREFRSAVIDDDA
jgi:hypothetical protein